MSMGVPSAFAANEEAANAWMDGRSAADSAHDWAETYREEFLGEPPYIPVMYRGGEREAAYRDGYAVRAQDLTDNES